MIADPPMPNACLYVQHAAHATIALSKRWGVCNGVVIEVGHILLPAANKLTWLLLNSSGSATSWQ